VCIRDLFCSEGKRRKRLVSRNRNDKGCQHTSADVRKTDGHAKISKDTYKQELARVCQTPVLCRSAMVKAKGRRRSAHVPTEEIYLKNYTGYLLRQNIMEHCIETSCSGHDLRSSAKRNMTNKGTDRHIHVKGPSPVSIIMHQPRQPTGM